MVGEVAQVGKGAHYLVVGGGLIGGAAAAALADNGAVVSVLTRTPAPQQLGRVEWHYGSLNDEVNDSLLLGKRGVVYAAGSVFPATKIDSVVRAIDEQVSRVVALAERAAAMGVRSFVFISSGGTVYGNTSIMPTPEEAPCEPITLYGTLKVMTEQALAEVSRRTGMGVVSLRVSNPYGPGQQGSRRLGFVAAVIDACRERRPVTIWGDGLNTRDFVYLDDVSKAICLAANYEEGAQSLNIGSGQEVTLLDVCKLVGEISGNAIDIIFEEGRNVDVRRNVLVIDKAARVLGWHPQFDLEAGIRLMCNPFGRQAS